MVLYGEEKLSSKNRGVDGTVWWDEEALLRLAHNRVIVKQMVGF